MGAVVILIGLCVCLFSVAKATTPIPESIEEFHDPVQTERCGGGKVNTDCGNPCDDLCDSEEQCWSPCVSGCFCPKGQIDVGGVCRDKAKFCNQCPHGQEYVACGSTCWDNCPGLTCTSKCVPGCYCPVGWKHDPKNKNQCIQREEGCGQEKP